MCIFSCAMFSHLVFTQLCAPGVHDSRELINARAVEAKVLFAPGIVFSPTQARAAGQRNQTRLDSFNTIQCLTLHCNNHTFSTHIRNTYLYCFEARIYIVVPPCIISKHFFHAQYLKLFASDCRLICRVRLNADAGAICSRGVQHAQRGAGAIIFYIEDLSSLWASQ